MTWQEVLDDPRLQNLPYKIELDQWGRIVMSPADNRLASGKVAKSKPAPKFAGKI